MKILKPHIRIRSGTIMSYGIPSCPLQCFMSEKKCARPQGWVQFHVELGIEVINSNSTGIGIGIGIEIILNPRIGIEYFLEKSNWN